MKIQERLKQAGLRVTNGRVEILELLENAAKPMSHIEILNIAPAFDRVTLYRVLDALVSAGFVHRVQGTDAIWRFCAHDTNGAGCPGGHPHMLCEHCGSMTCLVDQPMPHVKTPDNFSVSHKQLLIIGKCEKCQNN